MIAYDVLAGKIKNKIISNFSHCKIYTASKKLIYCSPEKIGKIKGEPTRNVIVVHGNTRTEKK